MIKQVRGLHSSDEPRTGPSKSSSEVLPVVAEDHVLLPYVKLVAVRRGSTPRFLSLQVPPTVGKQWKFQASALSQWAILAWPLSTDYLRNGFSDTCASRQVTAA